jgi:putative spermidine/putrescine transport system permease protein
MPAPMLLAYRRLRPLLWRSILLLFIGGPIIWAVGYAFAYSFGGIGRLSTGWTLEHWRLALAEPRILGSLVYSLVVALIVTTCVLLITLGTLLCFPDIRNSKAFLFAVVLMMGTPALVVAQVVLNTLSPGGWLSRLSYHAGLIESANDFPVLTNDRLGVGLTLAISLGLLPLALLYFSQLWSTVRIDRCCQLAESLGASWWDARWRVALPMLLSRGASMIMLLFILTLGSYEVPLLLGRQSPQMFSVATQRLATGFDLTIKPQAYVLASLYLVLTSLMLVFYIRGRDARE